MDAFREHETWAVTSENSVLDHSLVSSLLRPASKAHPPTEEQLHPWHVGYSQPFDVPLLRIWDQRSGSQPDANDCLKSREPRQRLDTAESRKVSLTTHINHSNWTPTPFISFTTSATAAQDLAYMRASRPNRGAQHLTAIDPNVRVAAGLPILDLSAEFNHYNIASPYGTSNQYCKDHYLCLWEVSGREIVGHWNWDDLAVHWNWYDEIVMPAFRKFRSEVASKSLRNESSDLSTAMGKLSLTSDLSGLDCQYAGDSDTPREGLASDFEPECGWDEYGCNEYGCDEYGCDEYGCDEYGWDTDDEVEEANASDNIIKIIEGDW